MSEIRLRLEDETKDLATQSRHLIAFDWLVEVCGHTEEEARSMVLEQIHSEAQQVNAK